MSSIVLSTSIILPFSLVWESKSVASTFIELLDAFLLRLAEFDGVDSVADESSTSSASSAFLERDDDADDDDDVEEPLATVARLSSSSMSIGTTGDASAGSLHPTFPIVCRVKVEPCSRSLSRWALFKRDFVATHSACAFSSSASFNASSSSADGASPRLDVFVRGFSTPALFYCCADNTAVLGLHSCAT